MPENCDAACVKNIINTRLVAYIATNLAEATGEGHPLYRPARILAAASRAACEAYAVAIEEGTLTRAQGRSGWSGCDDAEFLSDAIADVSAEKRPHGDGLTEREVFALRQIKALTSKANAVTTRLVRVQEA